MRICFFIAQFSLYYFSSPKMEITSILFFIFNETRLNHCTKMRVQVQYVLLDEEPQHVTPLILLTFQDLLLKFCYARAQSQIFTTNKLRHILSPHRKIFNFQRPRQLDLSSLIQVDFTAVSDTVTLSAETLNAYLHCCFCNCTP